METFPCIFTDDRLLKEVINAKFAFFTEDASPRLHLNHYCSNLRSKMPSSVLVQDLADFTLANYCSCPHCMGNYESLFLNWVNSCPLSGHARYLVDLGPYPKEGSQPKDIGQLLLNRIMTHYQVASIDCQSTQLGRAQIVSILPENLVDWLQRIYSSTRASTSLPIPAGLVALNDTGDILECAIRLWENAEDGPLDSLPAAFEAARTICS